MVLLNRMLVMLGLFISLNFSHLPPVDAASTGTEPVYYEFNGWHLDAGSLQFHFQEVDWLRWIQQTLLFNILVPTLMTLPSHLSLLGLTCNLPALATAGHFFHHMLPEFLPYWVLWQFASVMDNIRHDAVYLGLSCWSGDFRLPELSKNSSLSPPAPLSRKPTGQLSVLKDQNGVFHIQVPAYYYHPGHLLLAAQHLPLPQSVKNNAAEALSPLAELFKSWDMIKSFMRQVSFKSSGEALAGWLGWQHVRYASPRIGPEVISWLTPFGNTIRFVHEPAAGGSGMNYGSSGQPGILSYADKGQSSSGYRGGQTHGSNSQGVGRSYYGGASPRSQSLSGAGGGRPPRQPSDYKKKLPASRPSWEGLNNPESQGVCPPLQHAEPQSVAKQRRVLTPVQPPLAEVNTISLPDNVSEENAERIKKLVEATSTEEPMLVLYGSQAQRAHMLLLYGKDGELVPRDWDFKITPSSVAPILRALGVNSVPVIAPNFTQKEGDILWVNSDENQPDTTFENCIKSYTGMNLSLGFRLTDTTYLVLKFLNKQAESEGKHDYKSFTATFFSLPPPKEYSEANSKSTLELQLDFTLVESLPEAKPVQFESIGKLLMLSEKNILDHAWQMISTKHLSTGKMAPKLRAWWRLESSPGDGTGNIQHSNLGLENRGQLEKLIKTLDEYKAASKARKLTAQKPGPGVPPPEKPIARVIPAQKGGTRAIQLIPIARTDIYEEVLAAFKAKTGNCRTRRY